MALERLKGQTTLPSVLTQEATQLSDIGEIDPLDLGIAEEGKKGLVRGGRQIKEQYLSTFDELGFDSAGKKLTQLRSAEPFKRGLDPAPGRVNKAVNEIAAGVPELASSLGAVGAGVALGALTGGGALPAELALAGSIAARGWGSRVKQYRDSGLTDSEAKGLATAALVPEYLIERSLGVDQIMMNQAKRATLKLAGKGAVGQLASPAIKTAAKGILHPSRALGRAVAATLGETAEEIVQAPIDESLEWLINGDWDLTMDEMRDVATTSFLRSVPAGLVAMIGGGGVHDATRSAVESSMKEKPNANARALAYSKGGVATDAVEMDSMMGGMHAVLQERFSEEDAASATTVIRNVAENLASMDENALPQDFVNQIAVSFERGEVDQEAWAAATAIEGEAKRKDAMIGVLKQTEGFGREYYRVVDAAEAVVLKDQNDAAEKDVFLRTEAETSKSLNNSVAAPADGSPVFMVPAYAVVDEQGFSDLYKRGLVREVVIDGEKYTVHARGIVTTPDGGRFVVRPGELVFEKSEDAIGEAPALNREYESNRKVYIDTAGELDSEQAYRSRFDRDARAVDAEARGTADLVTVLKSELEQRRAAEVLEGAQTPEQRMADMQAEQEELRTQAASARAIAEDEASADAARAASLEEQRVADERIAELDRLMQEAELEQKQEELEQQRKEASGEAEAERIEAAEEKSRSALRREIALRRKLDKAGIDRARWLSGDEKSVGAYYDPDGYVMRFFNEATADDIVHEWFHHITETTGLLPLPMQDALKAKYVVDGEWQAETAVNDFLSYIKTRELPANASLPLVDALEHMRGVMAGAATDKAAVLSDESLKMFDAWFGMEDEDANFLNVARALNERTGQAVGFKSDEPLFSERTTTDTKIRFSATADGRGKMRQSIVGAFAKANKGIEDPAAGVREVAKRMFPDVETGEDGSVLRQLSDEQLIELHEAVKSEVGWEKTRTSTQFAHAMFGKNYSDLDEPYQSLVRKAMNSMDAIARQKPPDPETMSNRKVRLDSLKADSEALGTELNQRPRDPAGRARGYDNPTHMSSAYQLLRIVGDGIKRGARAVKRGALSTFDVPTLLTIMSDGNTDSLIVKKVGGMLYNSGLNFQKQSMASLDAITAAFKKAGLKNTPSTLVRRMNIAGIDLDEETVLGIEMVGRGDTSIETEGVRAGEFKFQQMQALWDSNGWELAGGDRDLFIRMVEDAHTQVQSHEYLGKMSDAIDDFLNYEERIINAERLKQGIDPMTKARRYFPLLRKGGMFVADDPIYDGTTLGPKKTEAVKSPQVSQKGRKSTLGKAIRLDVMEVIKHYRKQADIFTTKEATILYLQNMLNRNVQEFERAGMDAERSMLHDQLQTMRYHNGRATPFSDGELAVRSFTANYKMFALIGNMSSALRQTLSLPTSGTELPFSASLKLLHHQSELMAYYLKHMTQLKEGKSPLDGHPIWDRMVKGGSRHPHAKHDPAAIDIEESSGLLSRFKVLGLPANDAAMLPQRFFDQITRAASWGTAYEVRLAELRNENMTEDARHKEAFKFAEQNTSLSQPAADLDERAMIQKGNEFVRAGIPFTGQLFKNWNILASKMYAPTKQAWKEGYRRAGKLGAAEEVFQVFAGTDYAKQRYGIRTGVGHKMMYAYVVPALAMGMLARGDLPDSPDEVFGDLLAYTIAMIPIVGPIILGKLLYDKWQNNAAPVYYEFLNGAADVVANLMKGEGVDAAEDSVRLAAQATGFPNSVMRVVRESGGKEYTDAYGGFDLNTFVREGIFRMEPKD